MKTLKSIFAATFLVALLSVASFAQIQGPQTLSTTTLSSSVTAVGAGNISSITLASLTNVYATVSVGTRLWIDTEAMDVVTNSIPPSGTTILVQRGASGTKAEGHPSGRTVYVSRPNLFQGYDVAGTCWTDTLGTQLPSILPWINLTNGNRFDCRADGNWFKNGLGSQGSAAITAPTGFCTGTVASAATEYLNGAACSGASTATYSYLVTTSGELANLHVYSSANVVGGTSKDVLTVYKNGTATALTCTIAASAATCVDVVDGVATVAGDYIQFQFVTATSDTAANVSVSLGLYGQ
jgi:hypothetical protein